MIPDPSEFHDHEDDFIPRGPISANPFGTLMLGTNLSLVCPASLSLSPLLPPPKTA